MVNCLGRFILNLLIVMYFFFDLLKGDVSWIWGYLQEEVFKKVKVLLIEIFVLVFYDVRKFVVISVDISSYGIGVVLFQQFRDEVKSIVFVLRIFIVAEIRYVQIEKECLVFVWVCEKFERYISGFEFFKFLIDYKFLIFLINISLLDRTLVRC